MISILIVLFKGSPHRTMNYSNSEALSVIQYKVFSASIQMDIMVISRSLLILQSIVFNAHGFIEVNPNPEDDIRIVDCATELSIKYFEMFEEKKSVVVVHDMPYTSNTLKGILKSINELQSYKFDVTMTKPGHDQHFMVDMIVKNTNYLIIVTHLIEVLPNILHLRNSPSWNNSANVVVLFTEPFENDFYASIFPAGVFRELFEFSILKVHIIFQAFNETNLLQLMIWYPYEDTNCAQNLLNVKVVDECRFHDLDKEIEMTSLFEVHNRLPNKFHGCTLKVTTNVWEPFVIGKPNKTIEKGVEILMLQAIAEKLNMVLEYNVIDQKRAFGVITADNETGYYADLIRR